MNFKNFSIKRKLLFAFITLFLFSAVIAYYSYFAITTVILNNPAKALVDDINVTFLSAKQKEKSFVTFATKEEGFLTSGNHAYLVEHAIEIDKLNTLKEEILKLSFSKEVETQKAIKDIEIELNNYNEHFHHLIDLYYTRGFKDFGMEGEMRNTVRGLEKSGLNFDLGKMLMLRRHEKDFFLRKDLKYLQKFKEDAEDFYISLSEDPETVILQPELEKYKTLFEQITQVETKIGLDEKSGAVGEILKSTQRLNLLLGNFDLLVEQNINRSVKNTILTLIVLIFCQIVLSILLTIYFVRVIVRPVESINDKAKLLAKGQIPKIEDINGRDEIAQTQKSFNQLINNTKKAIKFAYNIGEGNFNYTFQTHKKDRMGNALLEMRERLKGIQDEQDLAKIEEEKQNWATEGVAFFGELLRKSNNNLQEMSYEILKEITDYVNAQQGAIYIKDKVKGEKKEILNLSAVFSGDRRKYNEKQLDIGEGIIGQTALENKKVVFTKVPESYKNIDSGMATFNPAMVLVLPLAVNGEVQGVLELSSVEKLEDHVIEFLEKLAESIASTISNVRVNETTKVLLENSQKMSEELRAQEEELRQNQEEMQATQEELNRQLREAQGSKEELQGKILELEEKLKG